MKSKTKQSNYTPSNYRHFEDMLSQFHQSSTREELTVCAISWVFNMQVDRQDILEALNRMSQKGWK